MRRAISGGTVTLPNIQIQRRNGKEYVYHRKTRKRLPDLPFSDPEFLKVYLQEESATAKPRVRARAGTIAAVVEAFKASDLLLSKSPDYQRPIRSHCEAISEEYGKGKFSDLRPAHIQSDIDLLEPNPANARRKAWRLLCKFAKQSGIVSIDPSNGVEGKTPPKTDGHVPWEPELIEAYCERWKIGTTQRLAFEILYWTGARVSDAVKLCPTHVGRDGILTYTQAKTKNPAHVPWTSQLPDWAHGWEYDRKMLHAAIGAVPHKGFTFLETIQNKARSKKGLSNLISDAVGALKVSGRSAHGLRENRLMMIAERGASAHAIMAWGGHVTLAEAQDYTRQAEKKLVLIGGEQRTNIVYRSNLAV